MDAVFAFADSFQVKVLGLLYHGVIPPSQLQPTYFQNPLLSEICDSLISLRSTYSDLTTAMVEHHLLQKKVFKDREYREELREALPGIFESLSPTETRYISDQLALFVKLEMHRIRVRQAQEFLYDPQSNAVAQLDGLFAQPISINGNGHDIGDFYFSSVAARIQRRQHPPEILRSLIPELDSCLKNGGFSRQSLALFAGLTSSGKTFALVHLALMAILQRKKTIFYSLEMSMEELGDRMDAALAGLRIYELREHNEAVTKALQLRQRLFGDNLLVKILRSGQTKVSDIRAHLLIAKQQGFVPEVIVLDHMNLMQAERESREGRHRDLGSVYVDLKGLSQEYNLWVVTAAQANRLGYQAKVLTSEHLAHSFEGAQNATYVITINRDGEEADQEKARLYIAKDQVGVDKKLIHIHTNFSKGAFYSRRARV